jgi:hypothetical protein
MRTTKQAISIGERLSDPTHLPANRCNRSKEVGHYRDARVTGRFIFKSRLTHDQG